VSGATCKTGGSAPVCNWNANGYRLPTEAEWEKAARGGVMGKNFPRGPTSGSFRVVRGGGWIGYAAYARCADRYYDGPSNDSYGYFGFRLARSSVP
jgi:formylglycine-generating enzyme required for sulfatase activity